ncbi:MAG: uroporphyrinogen-III C-methyltransferase, partial [Burkholderiaceae bacterium]
MGVEQLASIAHGLSQSLPGHTPAALVQHASLPQQRQWLTPLCTLAQTAQAAGVRSPAVVVVGRVLSGLAALHNEPARRSA